MLADRVVYLVPCGSRKRAAQCEARDLYVGSLFTQARSVAEASGKPWVILSALHGVVEPHQVLAPYDFTLAKAPLAYRAAWSLRVTARLCSMHPDATFVSLCSTAYDEGINLGRLLRPLKGLSLGKRKQWLSRELARIKERRSSHV
jgi:hypothetical protein